MTADGNRIPRFELSVEEAAELANALRKLSYEVLLSERQYDLKKRLDGWLRANGARKDMNGWWRVPSREEVAR